MATIFIIGVAAMLARNWKSHETSWRDYCIDGIPKTADIGGVDLSIISTLVGVTTIDNAPKVHIQALELTNRNTTAVCVILKVNYKISVSPTTYVLSDDKQHQIYHLILEEKGKLGSTRRIHYPFGNSSDYEIIETDIIVRRLPTQDNSKETKQNKPNN
ncbi:MAG: hypothetical protein K2M40_08265 [Muribaculaceae bacterium]|nr:hypothetical protein [Muribaculaceae bacterium]